MARPSKYPRWASGGAAQITEPSEAAKDDGHVPNTVLTAQLANWLQNLVFQWIQYLDEDRPALTTTVTPPAVAAAGATGTDPQAARADHTHAHGNQAASSTLHAAATTSVSGFLSAADKLKLDGVATSAAAVTSLSPTTVSVTTPAAGAGTTAARSDHVHGVSVASPGNITPNSVASGGVSTALSRADHTHGAVAAAPAALTVGAASATGSATSFNRSDHVHAMPGVATIAADGFMSAADKTLLGRLAVDPTLNNYRLSGSASNPITPDGSAYTTLYLTEYSGKRIALYVASASAWLSVQPSAQPTLALSGLTLWRCYDVFAYSTDGLAVSLEILAWSSDTARATALAKQDGVWIKTGDPTRRYLGTFRASGAGTFNQNLTGATDGSTAQIGLWNLYNRVPHGITWVLASNYNAAAINTWYKWGNYGSCGLELAIGLALDAVDAILHGSVYLGGTTDVIMGISTDGTSAGLVGLRAHVTGPNATAHPMTAVARILPTIGLVKLFPMIYATLTSAGLQGSSNIANNERGGISAIVYA